MTNKLYDLNIRCKSCTRFIKLKAKSSSEVAVVCNDRRCREENTIKVVMLSDYFKKNKHEH